MSQAPYMPVFTDALIGDTTHLTAEEFGCYCLLLFATWRNNGEPFPDDDARLRLIVRCPPRKWRRLREVLVKFYDISDGTWRQKRLEQEWKRTTDVLAAQRANAAQARTGRDSKKDSKTAVNETRFCTETRPENLPNELKSPETGLLNKTSSRENPRKKEESKILRGGSEVAALPSPPPPTPDEIVEVEALCQQATTTLRGGVSKGIRDPVAYQAAITDAKFTSLVKKLNVWVGTALDGEAQWAAWEVLAAAQEAGTRSGMDRTMRRNFNKLDKLYRATEPIADDMELAA